MLRGLAAHLDSCASRRAGRRPKLSESSRIPFGHTTACTLPITAESGESMAELAAEPGQARLPSREEAEQNYNEAVGEAVEACAADTAGQRCYICFGEGDEDEGLVRGCSCRGGNGCAHVSCLARGAQAADERDADTGWSRWLTCGLCEQDYHGVVSCALGWACWKTYVDRPEEDQVRALAMSVLGNGLSCVWRLEEASSVQEAQLSMYRRIGTSEHNILVAQSNLANTYQALGRHEKALLMKRDVYSGRLTLNGEEHEQTLMAAVNYASTLIDLERFEEANPLMCKTIPVARRVLGESDETTLAMRQVYTMALFGDDRATLDDLRESVTTIEESTRTARRVFGGAHPLTSDIEEYLQEARGALRAREAPDDETVDGSAQEDDADDIAAAPSGPSRPPTPATPASPAMPPPPVDAPPACFSCWKSS